MDKETNLNLNSESVDYHDNEQQNNQRGDQNHDHVPLELSLGIHPPEPPKQVAPKQPFQPPPPPHNPPPLYFNHFEAIPSSASAPLPKPPQTRVVPSSRRRKGKSLTIPEPYPWATNKRAIVHSLEYLRYKGISTITGQLRCKYSSFYLLLDGCFIALNPNLLHMTLIILHILLLS